MGSWSLGLLFLPGRYKQWTWDQGTRGSTRIQLFFGILYTSLYSMLVLGTSVSSLAWTIHFFPHHGVSRCLYELEIISASEKVSEADCILLAAH